MEQDFWSIIGSGLVIANTASVIILLELLILGKPYISFFAVIFFGTYKLNKRLFSRKK